MRRSLGAGPSLLRVPAAISGIFRHSGAEALTTRCIELALESNSSALARWNFLAARSTSLAVLAASSLALGSPQRGLPINPVHSLGNVARARANRRQARFNSQDWGRGGNYSPRQGWFVAIGHCREALPASWPRGGAWVLSASSRRGETSF